MLVSKQDARGLGPQSNITADGRDDWVEKDNYSLSTRVVRAQP
jgi:hypothetical protein